MARKPEIKIKSTKAIINVATPTEITNIHLLEQAIIKTKKVDEIIEPAIALDTLVKAYDIANKQLKETIKHETDKAKLVKEKIDSLKNAMKEKALKIVETNTIQKISKTTGEVTFKTEHNLPTEIFSFIPANKTAGIDHKEILANPSKYKKFVKEIVTYELDMEAIAEAEAEELPWTETVKEASISIKKITNDSMNKLLGVCNE